VGALYEAMPKQLWIGGSYQSRPNLTGMKKMKGKQYTSLPPTMVESVENVTLENELPDVYRLGGRYRPVEDLELRLFGDFTRWSVLKAHVVQNTDTNSYLLDQRRDWKDTFGVRAGVSKWLSKPVELFGGAGYSSNAVPNTTLEPALPDWNGISVSAGGRFEVIEKLFAAVSYTQLFYLPRDTAGDSQLTELSPKGAPRNPDSGGKYKQSVGVLNVNVDVAF
jgi:long-chain fatty acid transport protein